MHVKVKNDVTGSWPSTQPLYYANIQSQWFCGFVYGEEPVTWVRGYACRHLTLVRVYALNTVFNNSQSLRWEVLQVLELSIFNITQYCYNLWFMTIRIIFWRDWKHIQPRPGRITRQSSQHEESADWYRPGSFSGLNKHLSNNSNQLNSTLIKSNSSVVRFYFDLLFSFILFNVKCFQFRL